MGRQARGHTGILAGSHAYSLVDGVKNKHSGHRALVASGKQSRQMSPPLSVLPHDPMKGLDQVFSCIIVS